MKSKKKRVREITDYIKFVFPMLILYILFFKKIIQTRKVWFDVGYFNVVIYTVLY